MLTISRTRKVTIIKISIKAFIFKKSTAGKETFGSFRNCKFPNYSSCFLKPLSTYLLLFLILKVYLSTQFYFHLSIFEFQSSLTYFVSLLLILASFKCAYFLFLIRPLHTIHNSFLSPYRYNPTQRIHTVYLQHQHTA